MWGIGPEVKHSSPAADDDNHCPILQWMLGRRHRSSSFQSPGYPTRHSHRVRSMASRTDAVLSVVNQQLDAYNRRDLETFMTLLADNVHVSDGETGAVIATTKEELRPRYVTRFKSPIHCELIGRLCIGNTVVDREIITGLPDGQEADCLATYVVNESNLIERIAFVWKPRLKQL